MCLVSFCNSTYASSSINSYEVRLRDIIPTVYREVSGMFHIYQVNFMKLYFIVEKL